MLGVVRTQQDGPLCALDTGHLVAWPECINSSNSCLTDLVWIQFAFKAYLFYYECIDSLNLKLQIYIPVHFNLLLVSHYASLGLDFRVNGDFRASPCHLVGEEWTHDSRLRWGLTTWSSACFPW